MVMVYLIASIHITMCIIMEMQIMATETSNIIVLVHSTTMVGTSMAVMSVPLGSDSDWTCAVLLAFMLGSLLVWQS